MDTPSWRRVYTSRALRRAIAASGACRLPTCEWDSPRRGRTNTSHNGHSGIAYPLRRSALSPRRGGDRSLASAACGVLLRVGPSRFPHPGAVRLDGAAVGHPLPVAGTVALDHPGQLVVVGLGVVVP